jgi:hypothetical protein
LREGRGVKVEDVERQCRTKPSMRS